MKERIGHPAEHLPHWKQRRTEVPDSFSTLCTKSRFIVRAERVILVFFNAALLNEQLSLALALPISHHPRQKYKKINPRFQEYYAFKKQPAQQSQMIGIIK